MSNLQYGRTVVKKNDILFTIGNVYLLKDKNNNEIEVTLVRLEDHFSNFVKGRLSKKQVKHYMYKTADILYDVNLDDILCEVENRARFEKEDLESTTENNTEKE